MRRGSSRPDGVFVVCCAAAMLVACRAVLGVETLELVEAPADADLEADAPSDASGGPRPRGDGSCGPGMDCRRCCRESFGAAIAAFQELARDAGCLCGTGACQTECASSVCAEPPQSAAPPPCGPCVDDLFTADAQACTVAVAQCQTSPQCSRATDCFAQCR